MEGSALSSQVEPLIADLDPTRRGVAVCGVMWIYLRTQKCRQEQALSPAFVVLKQGPNYCGVTASLVFSAPFLIACPVFLAAFSVPSTTALPAPSAASPVLWAAPSTPFL